MEFYSNIFSAYFNNNLDINIIFKALNASSISTLEIDERITSYLRNNTVEIMNIEDLVITGYNYSWYTLIEYLIFTEKYLYLTKNIIYKVSLSPPVMITHARIISDKFKCDPEIIPYLQVFEIKQIMPAFRLNELCKWRNKWPQYINIKKLNKWIDNETWRLSMRNCWITACILV